MHFLLVRHLLDGVVIDLVHRVVGQGGLAGVLQQGLHQHLVALELDAVLDVVPVGELLLLGGLRQHDDVGEIGDEIFALLVGPHLRHVGADLVLGQRAGRSDGYRRRWRGRPPDRRPEPKVPRSVATRKAARASTPNVRAADGWMEAIKRDPVARRESRRVTG